MQYILFYLLRMAKYMAVALPFILLFRYFVYRKTRRFNFRHELVLTALILWIVGILSQTVFPREFLDNAPITEQMLFINLIPFRFVNTYFEQQNTTMDFLGNIGVFIPIGFLLPLAYRIGAKSVLLGAGFSLVIELLQLFSVRVTDINDLIFNTCGGTVGYLLYVVLNNHFPTFTDKFKTIPIT